MVSRGNYPKKSQKYNLSGARSGSMNIPLLLHLSRRMGEYLSDNTSATWSFLSRLVIWFHLELGILGIQYPRDKWLQSWANWAKKLTAMRPKYTCLSDNFVLLSLFWSPVYILGTSASLEKDGKGLKAKVYFCSMLLFIVWNDILFPGLSIYSTPLSVRQMALSPVFHRHVTWPIYWLKLRCPFVI